MQKLKTEKVTKEYLLLSQEENYLQKRNNLSSRERLQGSYPSGMFNPLGISDEFLFRNNFNDQKCILFEQGRFFHSQGNHFPAYRVTFIWQR